MFIAHRIYVIHVMLDSICRSFILSRSLLPCSVVAVKL